MIDACGRTIDHLRLSLTDHCNLACRYCVPAGAVGGGRHVAPEFAYQVVRWLSERHGVRYVRLTGGEPLLYAPLHSLIRRLARLEKVRELSLTTNGQALEHHAPLLVAAGLSRVNISLDTLNPERFASMTRGGRVGLTVSGIEAAVEQGLTPVKINVVVQRGFNEHEIADIAEWGLSLGCVVRFLEVMPIGPEAHAIDKHLVPASVILDRLAARFDLRAIPGRPGQPATDYAVSGRGLRGVIGVVAPTTRPFCERCRRIRVTSRGAIVACVHDDRSFDLSCCWDERGLDVRRADGILRAAVMGKPAKGQGSQSKTMIALGG